MSLKTEATDAERLDWLQERKETVYRCTHQERRATTDTFRHYETVLVFDGWAVFEDQDPKPTIREAIDFAMGRSSSLILDREEAGGETADSSHLAVPTNGPESRAEVVKNAAMIRAVLDGRHLQFRSGGNWVDCGGDAQAWITLLTLNSTRDNRYRVRPSDEAGA